jgi:V/A-type H+-transporting ATPase subunit K
MVLVFVLPLIVVALLFAPLFIRTKKGKSIKKALIVNLCAFFAVLSICIAVPVGMNVAAADETAATAAAVADNSKGLAYLGAALAVGLGSIGCGIAVGKAAPAAIGAVSEDPSSFSKSLIFVALGEGVAIYGLLIALLLITSQG